MWFANVNNLTPHVFAHLLFVIYQITQHISKHTFNISNSDVWTAVVQLCCLSHHRCRPPASSTAYTADEEMYLYLPKC